MTYCLSVCVCFNSAVSSHHAFLLVVLVLTGLFYKESNDWGLQKVVVGHNNGGVVVWRGSTVQFPKDEHCSRFILQKQVSALAVWATLGRVVDLTDIFFLS